MAPMFSDVGRGGSLVHLHSELSREVFLDAPQEDSRCELRRGWSLKMATHGPRDAAAVFDVTVERIMQDCGAMQGEFCPCVYGKCALMSWRHGDDVVVLGDHREFKDFA
eukprot:1260819-Pyramimonas_sp.AAC.1